MSLSPSFIQTLVLFILMAIGFAAGKMRILDEGGSKGISKLLVNFILPALIIDSMQCPFSVERRDLAYSMLGVSFLSYAFAFPLAWLLVKAIRAKGGERGAHGFSAIFSNCAFMGFPVVEAILGKDAIFAASIANVPFQFLAFSVGPYVLARTAGKSAKLGFSSFITPAAVASIVGFSLFVGGIALPLPIGKALALLGSTTTPLSMVLIGSIVSRMDFRAAVGGWRLYATSVFRLSLFPLALFGLLYALGLRGLLLSLPVILAAMPVAANSAILAEAYGGDAETSSSLVLVSTLLSVITIPLLATISFPAF
jgi:malate permease and related proteins